MDLRWSLNPCEWRRVGAFTHLNVSHQIITKFPHFVCVNVCEQKPSTELCHNRTDSTLSSEDQHRGENNRHRKSFVFFDRLAGSHLRVRFRSKHETVMKQS